MKCPDVVELERFVSSELEDGESASITEHLTSCQACAAEVAELQRDLELAASLRRDWTRIDEPESGSIETIGPYRILRKLGQGGMGTVFEAQQENPRRVVALKILRPGIVSESILNRFRHEAQTLGRLRHPGIAQIYEAGTYERPHGAQPYFVMELVHGQPLIAYADTKKLDLPQRLELMAKICDAVEHAHQRGVIHRDLKPDNILVDESGGEPQPKILDFGVARVIDPEGKSTTLHTSAGQIVGTIAYMSPEQASADPSDVDTRSDVYALGVICYELLAARLPYLINKASVAESVRAIVQDDPTPLVSVDRSLRGDVTTIVGKALEKDKARRYQSAAEMAADIRRHLRDEPITAHPPSTIYQLRKFARRNKGLVAGVAVAFVLLIVAIIGTSIGMVRAERNASKARTEAAKQAAVNTFLQEMLSSVDPSNLSAQDRLKGRDITVLQVLNQASEKLDNGSLRDQPEIELTVRHTLGVSYLSLAEYDLGARHLEAALRLARGFGPRHAELSPVLNSLANLRLDQQLFSEAETLAREALQVGQDVHGQRSTQAASAMNVLAIIVQERGNLDEAETLFRQALATRRELTGDENADVATSMNNLAMLLNDRGNRAEAEPLYRRALEVRRKLLGDEHPAVAVVLNNLAFVVREQGMLDQAEPLFREALAMRRKLLGDDHPRVALAMNNLASLLQERKSYVEAHELYKKAIDIHRRSAGAESPALASLLNNLASLMKDQGKLTEAESAFREALDMRRKTLGEDHPSVARGLANLAGTLREQGKTDEALPLFEQAIAIYSARFGEQHPDTANCHIQFGTCLTSARRFDEAEREIIQGRAVYEALRIGPEDKRMIASATFLVKLYEAWGKPEQAAAFRAGSTTQPATTRQSG